MTDKEFAARALLLVQDSRNLAANWGFYVFNPDFDREPELRNKIGCIWITGLQDVIEGESRIIAELRDYARDRQFKNGLIWLDRVSEYVAILRGVLSKFGLDEQLYLQDMRDQLVHGWLHKKHQDAIPIRYVERGELRKVVLSKQDYLELLAPLHALGPDVALRMMFGHVSEQKPRVLGGG